LFEFSTSKAKDQLVTNNCLINADEKNSADERWVSKQAQALLDARRRSEGQDRLNPDAAIDLAVQHLEETYKSAKGTVATSFRHGVIGLFADHVHYMPGFALFGSSRAGLAVAVRRGKTDTTRIAMWPEGSSDVFSLGGERSDSTIESFWHQSVIKLVSEIEGLPVNLDVSVVSSIPVSDESSFLATLCVALVDAFQGLVDYELIVPDPFVREAVVAGSQYFQSPAYVTGVRGSASNMFALTDSENCELVNFEISGALAIGYIELAEQARLAQSFVSKRREDAAQCLKEIQSIHPEIPSLAHLHHRDLPDVVHQLPRKLRYAATYLVKENQRVQRAITAARKGDWQLFGALLSMSNTALLSEWGLKSPAASFIVELVKDRTIDGLVGARINGNGRGVYIVGEPFSVPTHLDAIRKSFKDKFGYLPRTELL
jgi:galactokinase